ncbi:MAG: DUF4919 domain-containing protein [Bacteroidales bacterium]|nr:DUF4919 domain-containing protein [Bacteroidales bacterium]
MDKKYPQKLSYPDYEHSFSPRLLNDFEEGRLDGFDMETMRGLVYGYTFTEDYTKGVIPNAFSMDYWAAKHGCPQEQLLFDAISSTGEGLSKEDAICVICIQHEYEYLKREWPLKIKGQKLLLDKNIDCIEFEEGQMIDKLYFDISRWFERVKCRKYEPFGIFDD